MFCKFLFLFNINKYIYNHYSLNKNNMYNNTLPIKMNTENFYLINRSNNTELISGTDLRFKNTTDLNHNEIYKIKTFFEKMYLLELLNNEKISIFEKIDLLDDKSIKPTDITAGGLYKNTDFEF